MYGPTAGDLVTFLAIVLLVGALLGQGCSSGCSYVRDHVRVELAEALIALAKDYGGAS